MQSNTHLARAVKIELDSGEEYIGIEIPQEIIESMEYKHGEVLEVEVVDGKLILKRTGTIYNEDGN